MDSAGKTKAIYSELCVKSIKVKTVSSFKFQVSSFKFAKETRRARRRRKTGGSLQITQSSPTAVSSFKSENKERDAFTVNSETIGMMQVSAQRAMGSEVATFVLEKTALSCD